MWVEVAPAAQPASIPAPAPEIAADATATEVARQGAPVAPEEGTAENRPTPIPDAPAAPGCVDVEVCTELLAIAARAQTAFWEALRNLESAIGFELGDPGDLKEATAESLLAQYKNRRKPRHFSHGFRENSKTAQVVAMPKREDGATLEEIMSAMSWQKHTARPMLSAGGSLVKNHGLVVASEKDGETRRYFIKR